MKKLFGGVMKLIWVLIGIVCIVLVVWFAGPLLSFAEVRPLESVNARLVLIAVLLLLWLGRRAWAAFRAKLRNRKLFDALTRKPPAPPATAAEAAHAEALRTRFEQAMQTMRDLRLGERSPWLSRLSGEPRYVYQLPWYMFIGAPGSGKTTALLNSGLQFPLAKALGDKRLRGIGGTRHCDWWFTDQAVLIDTAGRYTTQDSDAKADAAEWRDFLGMLRRHRPRQPLNGVLVTVSVADLLESSPAALEEQALKVNERIQELQQSLQNSFPVYLLVTKADLVAGFNEFFEPLDREQREQVWGFTFDYQAKGPSGFATDDVVRRFDELVARVDALVLQRMQEERDPTRRAAIFAFPDQLASLRAPLQAFVAAAFPQTRLAQPLPARGFYLTSGTQEGTPIDRVMGAIARGFGLQRQVLPPMASSGRAYFLRRLLTDVIFRESAMAGTNLRWERRRALAGWGVAAASGLAALAAFGLWTWSYVNNGRYVDDVQAKVELVRKVLTQGVSQPDPRTLLALYDAMRTIASTEAVNPDDPPLRYRFGLFQGRKLAEGGRQAYERLLQQTLAPALANRLVAVLRQSAPNPELLYETLKTYVMLTDPTRLDAAAVRGWVAFDLELNQADRYGADDRREMLEHVDALLARNAFQEAIVLDERAMTEARNLLLRAPFPQRVYARVKRQGVPKAIPEFRIDRAGGPSTALVFERPSGRPLTQGVPAFYTRNGYFLGVNKALLPAIREMADEEVWVLGVRDSANARRAADAAGRESLANEVRQLYLQEYGTQWEQLLADVAVKRGQTLSEIIQGTRLLSAPNESPLPKLLRAIVTEVTLTEDTAKPGADRVVDRATEVANETRRKLEELLGRPPAAEPGARKIEAMVDDRFAALRQFARGTGAGPAPVDKAVELLNELYVMLTNVDAALQQKLPPPASEVPGKLGAEANRMPEPVRGMVTGLARAGASLQQREQRQNVNTSLRASVSEFCTQAIAGRYPFTPGSKVDVTVGDFTRLFAPAGLIDDFFQKNLLAQVDVGSKPWKFRRTGDGAPPDSGSLLQFQRAAEIRSVFFALGPAAPAVRIEMKPVDMDPELLQFSLDVDGQVLKYGHGPSVPKTLQWPGPGGTNQIRLQVSPPGASGTSGQVFEGPWAIFRMFEQASITSAGQPEKFRATFNVDGRKILFDVTASSVQNPFRLPDLQAFRCPTQL